MSEKQGNEKVRTKKEGAGTTRRLFFRLLPFSFFLLPFLFFVFVSLASACPGCKEALFEPGQVQVSLARARAYALTIGLMLGMPSAMIGGVTVWVVRAHRRARQLGQGRDAVDTSRLSR